DLPLGMRRRQVRQERPVHPLVDDAEKAQTGMWQEGLVLRLGQPVERLPEVFSFDRRGKEVNVRMPVLFGTVKAWPASEDYVCPLKELPLALDELGRRKVE